MDGELWTTRMPTSKRRHFLHPSQSTIINRPINIDDVDGEEDVRPDLPCPYCYEDFDATSLCSHLEDEHYFESKVVTCPVCATKIPKDMVGHITMQHGQFFKISF
ncbi:unnamed protein product [Sphagnum troendelagicum]|uniref:Di19 zinc-binding domain-containing protein n=1 Tax=Sphagnum troendelagicum TaxID=128251 RepID=A0ABP0T7J4_9BRYO